jgi:hypothetical protein
MTVTAQVAVDALEVVARGPGDRGNTTESVDWLAS